MACTIALIRAPVEPQRQASVAVPQPRSLAWAGICRILNGRWSSALAALSAWQAGRLL